MSRFERIATGSFLKKLIPVVALALFMAPSVTNAELLLQTHDVWGSHPAPETSRQTVRRPVDICLNENGDLVIRRSDVWLTVAYAPPNYVIEPQERLRIAQRLDFPSLSGIILKLSLQF